MISFPIALGLAFILAHGIRRSTDRAQISGNRKNGLLVESLDSAETVKANRGGWYMLGRWNRLLQEVHAHEYPVKRWSAVSSSIRSEEHTSELQSLMRISYAVFCLKKKKS